MSKFIFVLRRYCPEEAWSNRTLACAKGLAECGVDVQIYYLIPDKHYTNYSVNVNNVKIIDLWKNNNGLIKHFRKLSYVVNLFKVNKYITNDDFVFLYGGDYLQLRVLSILSRKSFIYTEITEHPDIIKRSYVSKFLQRKRNLLLRKIEGLFVISQSLKKYFITQGITEDKIHVLNMFVDTERFSNIQRTSNQKYIAYCGIVSYEKDGVDTLIKAFSIFVKQHNDYNLKIIGRGLSEDVIPRLSDLADCCGIKERVEFTGLVDRNYIPQLLINATILVLARPDNLQSQNGFPTKLGEYLATGNPTLVTAVGEIPLFIKDGINGFLSKPNSPQAFSDKLCWIADNYTKATLIGAKGRELTQTEFSYKSQVKKIIDIMNVKRKGEIFTRTS